jgi:hypothetical protein
MITKTRSDFCQTITVNGIQEKDINLCQWELFSITRPLSYYQISDGDKARPDLLSLKIYGTMDYWWVLCKHNKIDDLWNDLVAGEYLECPNVQDIQDYYIRAKIL